MRDTTRPSPPYLRVIARARRALRPLAQRRRGVAGDGDRARAGRAARADARVGSPLGEVEWPGAIRDTKRTIPVAVPLVLAPDGAGRTLLDGVSEVTAALRGVRERSLAQLASWIRYIGIDLKAATSMPRSSTIACTHFGVRPMPLQV